MEENNRLIDGIIREAEKEAGEILEKAKKTAAEKNSALDSKFREITGETDEKISLKLNELERRADASIKAEIRRKKLEQREKTNKEVSDIFYRKIGRLISTEEYKDFLCKLIAEGAIAVNDSEAVVRCSFHDKVDDAMLEKAEKIIKKEIGKTIKLSISREAPLVGQGIVVESSSGRISYNNQIESRLRRFDEDIKMIIINGLTKE